MECNGGNRIAHQFPGAAQASHGFDVQGSTTNITDRSGDNTYMTTYQRDMGVTEAWRGSWDNVGKSTSHKGKRMFPTSRGGCPVGRPASFGSQLADQTYPSSRSSSACTGHLPGYTGHIPQSQAHKFVSGGDVRTRTHQKDFFLLPDNYRDHVAGYTGNSRSAIEKYKDEQFLLQ